MDRFLTSDKIPTKTHKGGVHWALPLCLSALCLGLGPRVRAEETESLQTQAPVTAFDGSLDVGTRLLYSQTSVLNSLAASAGFPKTKGLWMLWGGGATLTPGDLRAQVSAWTGSQSASSAASSSAWDLGLAAFTLEQAYPVDSFIFTAGGSLEGGTLNGSLIRGDALTGVTSLLFGYSLQAGVRWPAQTPLSFFLRAGWEMLSGPGTWHGTYGPQLGSTLFELGGPTATLQVELSL